MRVRIPLPATTRIQTGVLTLALAASALTAAHAPRRAVAGPVHATPAAATTKPLTAAQASARAAATGQPVIADAATTPTAQTTANPDGTFTLTTSPAPVRVRKNGAWVPLDASLVRNSDGTYSPTASTGALTLSGGGSGPLAVLDLGGRQLSITLPATLPAPTVSGNTATYISVLPDTDLVVTSTAQGGLSDVFVVKTATAATNPALSTLMKASVASIGLTVATDTAGELSATDPGGATIFNAPTATAWDSTTAAPATPSANAVRAAVASPSPSPTPTGVDPVSGQPLTSSVDGPGEHARTASLNAAYTAGTLTLTPPTSLLTGSGTHYPVYLDPSVGPAVSAWTMVNSTFPDQSYYGVGTNGHMQVGHNGNLEGCAPCFTARSFTTLDLSGVPAGAVVSDAQVNFWEDWAPSCSARQVDLYVTGPIYPASSPNKTTWNHQPSWGASPFGTANVAKGYSGCSAGGVGFGIKQQVIDALNGGGKTLTLGLQAHDETDDYGWKQFNGNVSGETPTNASITYDLYPSKPGKLYTSPSTSCTYNTSGDTVGDTGMTLYAPVSSPVGSNLTTTFTLYRYGDNNKTNLLIPSNNIPSDQYAGPSGQPAVMALPESFFKTLAAGQAISLSWIAQSSDGTLASPPSDPCTFTWDPTRPGNPAVAPTPTSQLPADGSVIDCPLVPAPTASIPPIGSTCGFTVTPPNGSTVSGYLYQLNDGAPVTIPLGSDPTQPVNFTLTLPSLVNTLTVSALSAGGNIGSSLTIWFDGAILNPPAKDGDLNHDDTPDVIIPGQSGSAFPPGLWLATGHADGTTTANAINIGTAGLWSTTPTATSPGEWTGSQTITGDFCGNGAQDVLAFFPGAYNASSNPHGAGGAIVCSNANTSPLDVTDPIQGYQHDITQGTLVDSGGNGAGQVANAGNITAKGTTDPDLLATIGTSLYLFPATGPGAYTTDYTATGTPTCTGSCADLAQQNTPDGTQDWDQWTITSSQDTRNGNPAIDLYLWKRSTGALYLWAGLGLDKPLPGTTQLTKASYTLHTGTGTDVWPPNTTASQRSGLILRAADINSDGLPDLWAIDPSANPSTGTGTVTGYLPTSLGGDVDASTATSAADTANHAWLFQDIGQNTAGAALNASADTAGSLSLTGSIGAVWNTGDLYSPDALLNTNTDGTVNTAGQGQLTTTGPAVTFDTNHDFTIAARVRANALGGTVLSQDGANTAGFTLTADKTSGDWQFCMAQTDTTSPARDCAAGPAAQLGLWTQLTATYNHNTGVMTLYINGADTAMVSHSPASGFTGTFRIGAQRTNSTTVADYYSGQIADVHTWNEVAPPAQPQTAGSVLVPVNPTRIMDTRNGTGGTTGPIAASATVPLTIDGANGVPATGVTAVALTITDTAATGTGHLTVYPDGTAAPATSAVNFPAGTTVANGVIVPVGADGKIDILNSINTGTGTGSSQIIADLTGYFTTNTTATGASTYTPFGPVRALDTRNGTGAPKAPIAAGATLNLGIAGVAAGTSTIPAGISAVAINIGTVNQATGGYLIAYPDRTTRPIADTTVSFNAGQAIAAASIVPVGTDGKINLYNASGGTIDAIADIVGYFTPGTTGQKYHPLDATRLFDTRLTPNNALAAFQARPVPQNVISAVNPTLVANLTATQETGGGNLAVLPDNVPYSTPATTSLIYNTTGSIANLDLAATKNNYFTVLNYSSATTQLIIDTNGYFANY